MKKKMVTQILIKGKIAQPNFLAIGPAPSLIVVSHRGDIDDKARRRHMEGVVSVGCFSF
jgi:hypothetical protein